MLRRLDEWARYVAAFPLVIFGLFLTICGGWFINGGAWLADVEIVEGDSDFDDTDL